MPAINAPMMAVPIAIPAVAPEERLWCFGEGA